MASKGNGKRGRWPWLVAAVLLAVAGAWLMFSTDPVIAPEREVSIPLRMTPEERSRAAQRRTIVELPPMSDAGVPLAAAPAPRDPVMALMPPTVQHGAMVAEFNAIVNSDLGGLMMQCMFDGNDPLLGRLRDAGVDPATSIDRVAFIDDALVVTGNFKGDAWKSLVPGTPIEKDYGRQGRVYEYPQADGGAQFLGSWGGQMLLTGESRESVQASLDRLESTGPHPPGVLTEEQAYGEVYGVVGPSVLAELIGQRDEKLGQTVREAASNVSLHVDLQHDMGLVADVKGDDPAKQEELRRALGGALSLARIQAQAKGKAEEAQLLDEARVQAQQDGQFRMTAGVPYEYMQKVFTDCVERKRRARAGSPDAGAE
jgi:hypothetical protein